MIRLDKKYLKGVFKYVKKRLSYFISGLKNRFIHETVDNPNQLIWVSPAAIDQRLVASEQTDLNIFEKIKEEALPLYDLELGAFDPRRDTGRIMSGDWDLRKKPYDGEILFESYNQRFNQAATWEDTAYFRKGAKILENGGILYGCRSLEEFKSRRLAYVEKLYYDIKDNGYSTQSKSANKDERSKGIYHEISVNIGRNGELIYNNATGNNRLALSKVLKLEKVPVLVVVRHKQWELQKKRIRLNKPSDIDERLVEQVRNHPDFQDPR